VTTRNETFSELQEASRAASLKRRVQAMIREGHDDEEILGGFRLHITEAELRAWRAELEVPL
jgi:hypothetical protein